jgi:hypothetical protein
MDISIENIGKEQDKYLLSLKPGEEIWCTEKKLQNIIINIFPKNKIIFNKKIKDFNEKSFIPDILIEDLKLIIEFQGYKHYTDSLIVWKDIQKKEICKKHNYTFIEFPYFIQPTQEVLETLFGTLPSIKDFSGGFPHGFIHPLAVLPGNFCVTGLKRYKELINSLSNKVQNDINNSLKKRASVMNIPIEYINPIAN